MAGPQALVLVTTSFPIAGDGSEAAGSFVGDLVEAIAECMPVRVVAPGPASRHETWAHGIDVYRYAAPDRPLSMLKPWKLDDALAITRVLKTGESATRQAVDVGPAAHVLALWALPSGHWARRASQATGVPYSVWTLGSDIWSLGRMPLVRTWLRRVLHDADACYSDGLQLADDTRRIAGRAVEFLPSTRCITRQRIEPPRTAPPYRLLFLGRWHPNKGVDLLIDALGMLSEEDWRHIESIDICGGGPLEPLVSAEVAALKADGRPVLLGGYLDKVAAEDAFLRADFLLIPSRIESIPVVFSDAMKLGCPVVCMPVGDLPRLVAAEPATGVVACDISAKAFARALSKALASPASQYGNGIRTRAAQFGLSGVVHRLVREIRIAPDD